VPATAPGAYKATSGLPDDEYELTFGPGPLGIDLTEVRSSPALAHPLPPSPFSALSLESKRWYDDIMVSLIAVDDHHDCHGDHVEWRVQGYLTGRASSCDNGVLLLKRVLSLSLSSSFSSSLSSWVDFLSTQLLKGSSNHKAYSINPKP